MASHLALDGLYYVCMGWKTFGVRPVRVSERGLTFIVSSHIDVPIRVFVLGQALAATTEVYKFIKCRTTALDA